MVEWRDFVRPTLTVLAVVAVVVNATTCPESEYPFCASGTHAYTQCCDACQQNYTTCDNCAPGFYTPQSRVIHFDACVECSPGFYADSSGAVQCEEWNEEIVCSPGFYFQEGSSTSDHKCSECPSGQFQGVETDSITECQNWTVGSHLNCSLPTVYRSGNKTHDDACIYCQPGRPWERETF